MPKYYPPFIAKTEEPVSSGFLYERRSYYKDKTKEIFDDINSNYIDLWYETPLYGKVDPAGRFVFPKNTNIVYPSATDPSGAPNILGFDFALKAIEEYIFFLRRSRIEGKTGLNSLLNNFKFFSGYTDSFESYRQYISNNLKIFNHFIIKTGRYSKLTNFENFTCEMLNTMEAIGENLTFFHYFTNNKTNLTSTGLSFRFLEADEDDDYIKNKFFQHPEFAKYVNTSANFGFRINKNAPWEIIVDVNSKPMMMNRKVKRPRGRIITVPGYLQEKLITSPEDFFRAYYRDVMQASYSYFKRLLIFSYNKYVDRIKYTVDYGRPYIIADDISDIISDKEFGRTQPTQLKLKSFDSSEYNELYFIKKYERMLNIEFKNKMNKIQYTIFKNNFDNIVNKTQSYGSAYNLLDDYYHNLTKIYNPQTKKLMWNSPKKTLTTEMKSGKIQTKDQPTVGKIVTEFLPDI